MSAHKKASVPVPETARTAGGCDRTGAAKAPVLSPASPLIPRKRPTNGVPWSVGTLSLLTAEEAYTVVHRPSRRGFPCLQRRSFCVLPSCCLHLQLAQFVLLMSIQYLMERTDGVEQTAVVLETGPGEYGGVLCADEPFVSESADVFAHRIDAQLSGCTDGFVAGPALMGAPVCASEQVGVHHELPRR